MGVPSRWRTATRRLVLATASGPAGANGLIALLAARGRRFATAVSRRLRSPTESASASRARRGTVTTRVVPLEVPPTTPATTPRVATKVATKVRPPVRNIPASISLVKMQVRLSQLVLGTASGRAGASGHHAQRHVGRARAQEAVGDSHWVTAQTFARGIHRRRRTATPLRRAQIPRHPPTPGT